MLALAPLARAQATRTWVSGVGDDANPCSRTAPCKTFAGAISKTAPGGEISVLDPGGFGGVTITKSMTIDGGGGAGFGSILASGFTGILINAASTDTVTLRNLSINGAGTTPGTVGIRIINAGAGKVMIENCQIFGFNGGSARGVSDERSGAGPKKLFIKDTIARNNGSGIVVNATGAFTTGTLDNVQLVGNSGVGLVVDGGHLRIANSEVSGNGSNGISVNQAGAGSFLAIDTVGLHVNGGAGLSVTGGGVTLSNAMITDNAAAGVSGIAVSSFQNNKITGNGGGINDLPVGSTNVSVK